MGWFAKLHLQTRLILVFILVTMSFVALTSWLFFTQADRVFFEGMRERLRQNASMVAAEMDGNRHDALRSMRDPAYSEMKRHLVAQRKAAETVRDIYTLKPGQGRIWTFVVDAEDPDSALFSRLGEPYDTTHDPALPQALGGPTASSQIYQDTYGVWLSGYAPIHRKDGTAVGVVGVDMSAKSYLEKRDQLALISFALLFLGLAGATVLSILLARQIANPIEKDKAMHEAIEADLEASRDHALEVARMKSEFLATMSHEIRTPMNGVLGMTDVLLSTPLSSEQREYASILRDSAQLLLTIINDILDAAKLEAGKLAVEAIPFALRPVMDNLVDLLAVKAHEKDLDLLLEVSPQLPTIVMGDPVRLKQILLNLTGNAIKFTTTGHVRLALLQSEAGGLRFEVSDTGVGLSPEVAKTLFQPFVQADSSTSRRFGGTGLGLSISKALVEMMGGTIGVQSVEGVGSTFWFELPHILPDATENLEALVPERPREGAVVPPALPRWSATVLLVDDNRANQMVARLMLRRLGLVVIVVDNGQEAVKAVAQGPFDLVFMDCRMPVMDGFAAATAIRASEEGAAGRLPIIALTADAQDEERCMASGMDGFLCKPFTQAQLIACLQQWLGEGEFAGGEYVPEPPVQFERLQEAFGTDPIVMGEICDMFSTAAENLLAAMRNSLGAREKQTFLLQTHELKGSSGTFRAMGMFELCKQLEDHARREDWPAVESTLAELEREFARVEAAMGPMRV